MGSPTEYLTMCCKSFDERRLLYGHFLEMLTLCSLDLSLNLINLVKGVPLRIKSNLEKLTYSQKLHKFDP